MHMPAQITLSSIFPQIIKSKYQINCMQKGKPLTIQLAPSQCFLSYSAKSMLNTHVFIVPTQVCACLCGFAFVCVCVCEQSQIQHKMALKVVRIAHAFTSAKLLRLRRLKNKAVDTYACREYSGAYTYAHTHTHSHLHSCSSCRLSAVNFNFLWRTFVRPKGRAKKKTMLRLKFVYCV